MSPQKKRRTGFNQTTYFKYRASLLGKLQINLWRDMRVYFLHMCVLCVLCVLCIMFIMCIMCVCVCVQVKYTESHPQIPTCL